MKPLTKAIVVALIQATLVCSLGAKLLYDRSTRPRAWFKAERFDPNLPIRGRYLSLQLEVKDPRSREEIEKKYESQFGPAVRRSGGRVFPGFPNFGSECGSIEVREGTPIAALDSSSTGYGCSNLTFSRRRLGDEIILGVDEPVLFFISDTAQDPSRLEQGEELWVLATIPRKGPPRPISLGIKKAGETEIRTFSLN
jgi:hypothetical protein